VDGNRQGFTSCRRPFFVRPEESVTNLEIEAVPVDSYLLPGDGILGNLNCILAINQSHRRGLECEQDKGGEKLPGVLSFELYRRRQVLPPKESWTVIDRADGNFGSERLSRRPW
jgi:hypothetical protein